MTEAPVQRTAPPVRTRSLLSRGARLVVAGLVALGTLVAVGAPAGAAQGPCVASPSNACITGTIRTAAGEPAVGVGLTVEGPGETVTTTTGDDGTWSVSVAVAGDWAITVEAAQAPIRNAGISSLILGDDPSPSSAR